MPHSSTSSRLHTVATASVAHVRFWARRLPRLRVAFTSFAAAVTLAACASDGPTEPTAPPVTPPPAPSPETPAPAPTLGALIIEIDAPAGSTPNVVVSSATVQRIVRQTRTIDSLPPGVYQISADDILTDSVTWAADAQSVQVLAAQTAPRAVVKFRPVGASIIINASGLPSYARATVRLSGPKGLERTALTRDTVRLLPPGTYTLVADPVETTDGRFEAAEATQSIKLNGNQTGTVDFAFSEPKAALTVSVDGLPNGVLAGIAVTGPSGFSDRVDATRSFSGLEAGLYRATAARVSSSGFSYDPDATTRDVTMSGAQARSMAFTYRLATGAMAVTVGGLPAGANGSITVTGPSGYSRAVTSTQTLTDLAPGTYRLTASAVTVSGVAYTPTPAIVDVIVTASLVAAPAEFQYAGSTGTMAIAVDGLPPTLDAAVKVTRPNGSNFWLTGSETVHDLPVGDYTVEAQTVTGTRDSYDPEVTVRAVKVRKNETTNTQVRYVSRTGGISVSVVGLPSGVPAAVRVTGPNNTDIAVTSSTTLTNLAVGTYTITVGSVSSGTTQYTGAPASASVSVVRGTTKAHTVSYGGQSTALTVDVSGLPGGTDASATVTGPNGFTRTVTGPVVLENLVAGSYRISAASVSTSTAVYTAAPSTVDISLAAGDRKSHTIAYALSTGSLAISVAGLPSGTSASVTVAGPNGFSQAVSGTQTLLKLAPGTYTVTASNVLASGVTYTATPALRTVSVTASLVAAAAPVTYGNALGGLRVAITGLPTQASGAVTTHGPNNATSSLSQTAVIGNLAVGSWEVRGHDVTISGERYSPTPVTRTISVVASDTVDAPVAFSRVTGRLALTVSGLPSGTNGSITVSGPSGFSRAVTSSQTLVGLEAGSYTIAASAVTVGSTQYTPSSSTQTVSVAAGGSISRSVSYSGQTTSLAISVSGVPSGAEAAITATGPNSFSEAITATTTLSGLSAGTYTLAAARIVVGNYGYSATPASQSVALTTGDAKSASVAYAVSTGALTVSVTGLPSGVNAPVTVTGPGSFSKAVTSSQTLADLAPGTYTVTASSTTSGATSFTPSSTSQTVAVSAGATASRAVNYTGSTTSLTVTVSGVPTGATAAVTVTGPDSFSQTVAATQTLNGLAPGTYTVSAATLTSGGFTYTGSPASATVALVAGDAKSHAVTYAATTGRLAVNVSGLPSGTSGSVLVTGPSGFSQAVTATTTLSGLSAGTYTVAASNVASGGYTYAGAPASQTVSVTTGTTKSASVSYAATTGRLTVSVSGLPSGTSSAVTVTGPGSYSKSVTASTTLTGLDAGTYTIAASNVVSGGSTYAPSAASQTKAVSVGATASTSVAYAVTGGDSGGGGGSTGANLSVEGAYVTQAIQSFAGDVPLVADREALLRVFVKADAANSLTPTVRVRLFTGSTNFRTFTISAPSSSVPTAIAEGTLNSSWNATLSASDMRVGLRIQVDVDPTNAVIESQENDNVYPSSGTKALDVRTVAPFDVVFLPVHQKSNGLTGAVSTSNLEDSYLSMTRRIFPLNDINASVRSTYTTNTEPLQSSNGNGAWFDLLREINSLRVAEGSSAHYYGVVKTSYSSGIAGYAYVQGRAAIGWDKSSTSNRITAHELGHNFSRSHVAACGSGNTDSNYPYASGTIGNYGWNSGTNTIVNTSVTDVMGYCGTQWISDYTWSGVMNFRGPAPMMAGFSTGPQPTLMVWGSVQNGVVTLEPALRLVTNPVVAARAGSYRLELRDESGRVITGFSFDPEEVDHEANAGAFAFAVPLSSVTDGRLHSVAIVGGASGVVQQTARVSQASQVGGGALPEVTADGGAAMVTDPMPRLSRSGSVASMSWDDQAWPLVLVKDLPTGQTLSYLRQSGDAFVPRSGTVRVTFSNGIRSVTRDLNVP